MKIAMSGCFDMFHPGHRYILMRAVKFAEDEGQVLVLINTDESIKELKGKDRPKQNLEQRMEKIQNFIEKHNCPNIRMIPFTTEEELLFAYKVINPDIIVHGDDLVDITKATGYGEFPFLLIPRQKTKNGEELSTTAILKRKKN